MNQSQTKTLTIKPKDWKSSIVAHDIQPLDADDRLDVAQIDALLKQMWDNYKVERTPFYWLGAPEELRKFLAKTGKKFTNKQWSAWLTAHTENDMIWISR